MRTVVAERPASPIPLTANRGFHPIIESVDQPPVFIDTCVQVWRDADFANVHRHGVTAIAMTAWTPHVSFEKALEGLMYAHLLARQHPNMLVVNRAEDILRARHENKLALIMASQDGTFVGDKLHRIEAFYRLGLRILIPAYNATNSLGAGCLDRVDSGLTRFGELVVDECNRVGLLLDCTHTGKRTSLEILDRSSQPVVFTHSNVKALAENPRNIDDEQIKACIAKRGVIGLSPWGPMALKTNSQHRPTLDEYFEHMDHIANLAGSTDNIGIGTDFCFGSYPAHPIDPWGDPVVATERTTVRGAYNRVPGMTLRLTSPERYAEGFSSYHEVTNLIDMLRQRKYTEKDVQKILGENYLRVFEQVWK
jgi:membrane dipeptidase